MDILPDGHLFMMVLPFSRWIGEASVVRFAASRESNLYRREEAAIDPTTELRRAGACRSYLDDPDQGYGSRQSVVRVFPEEIRRR